MGKFLLLMLPLFALTSCQTVKSGNVCDVSRRLTPKLETSVFILKNDRPFADQVAAHNRLLGSIGCK